MTPIDSGDPRLTAYALGELSTAEALTVEAWLLKSPEARADVQGIRNVVALLREGFGSELESGLAAPEPAPAFSVVRIDQPVAERDVPVRHFPRRAVIAAGLAAAAALALSVAEPEWLGLDNADNATLARAVDPSSFRSPIPGLDAVSPETGGVFLASAGGFGSGAELRDRSLVADPVITEVRFLSDDPTGLGNLPLAPELASYLPAPRGAPAPAVGVHRASYLDADRYPNAEIVPSPADWEDARVSFAPAFPSLAADPDRANELKETGRRLFLAGEYESAALVFEKALEQLPGSTAAETRLRGQIEALLTAARDLAGSRR